MTRSELIDNLAARFPGLKRSDTEAVVMGIMAAMADSLATQLACVLIRLTQVGVRPR